MKFIDAEKERRRALLLLFYTLVLVELMFAAAMAQNLGSQPAVNKSVQGQTAAQPEGAFLNLVNWVGNVIAPVGGALRGDGHCQLHPRTRRCPLGGDRCRASVGFRINAADRVLDFAGPRWSAVEAIGNDAPENHLRPFGAAI